MWETAGPAAERFRTAEPDERRELASGLVKQATWGEGRLEVALKPPFDVILREVQKVRAAEKVGDGGTRTPPKPQHSNSPGRAEFEYTGTLGGELFRRNSEVAGKAGFELPWFAPCPLPRSRLVEDVMQHHPGDS